MKRWRIGIAVALSAAVFGVTLATAPAADAAVKGSGHVSIAVEPVAGAGNFRLHISCWNDSGTNFKVYTRQRIEWKYGNGFWQSYSQTQSAKQTLKPGLATQFYSPSHYVSWGTTWRVWGDCLRYDHDTNKYVRVYVKTATWDQRANP